MHNKITVSFCCRKSIVQVQKLLCIFSIALLGMNAEASERTDVICSYAPSQSAAVNRIADGFGGAGLGAVAILQATGMSAVLHSSGAYIFTGAGGYVAGTLGVAIVAPILITTSIVVGGSAIALELSCAPKNHPDSTKKMNEILAVFHKAALSANAKAIVVRDNAGKNIRTLNDHAIDVRDAAANKLRVTNDHAIDVRHATAEKLRAANESAIEFRDRTTHFFSLGVF